MMATLLLCGGLSSCRAAQETPAVVRTLPVFPEVDLATRVQQLPAAERPAWRKYLERSQALAKMDQAALDAELAANGMTSALPAPEAPDFKLPAKTGDAWYGGEDAKTLTATILSYQTASGGWSKHTAYSAGPRKPGMLWSSQYKPGSAPHYLSTFDNRSTTEQLQFLANIWQATHREDCKAAFLKGLDFVLAAQYPSGGWPQVYPVEGGYHDAITFNDDAMVHVLELFRGITSGESRFAFVDDARRVKVQEAAAAGLRCILRSQIIQNGKPTVWCAQHDPLTLAPVPARKFEPASLSGGESVGVVRYLMGIEAPSAEIKAAITNAINWFQASKVTGIDVVGKPNDTGGTALVAVADPAAAPVWARFYELGTNRPMFVDRETHVYYSIAELPQQGKGYSWYVKQPGALLEKDYPAWQAKWGGK